MTYGFNRAAERVERRADGKAFASKFLIKNEINFRKLFVSPKHLNLSFKSPPRIRRN